MVTYRQEVAVKVSNRRFWSFSDGPGEMKPVDMADVISKLRDLKAG